MQGQGERNHKQSYATGTGRISTGVISDPRNAPLKKFKIKDPTPRTGNLVFFLADVFEALLEYLFDVVVGEGVEHVFPFAPVFYEVCLPKRAQLMGDGGLRHAQEHGQVGRASCRERV